MHPFNFLFTTIIPYYVSATRVNKTKKRTIIIQMNKLMLEPTNKIKHTDFVCLFQISNIKKTLKIFCSNYIKAANEICLNIRHINRIYKRN